MAEFDRDAEFSDRFGRSALRIASEKTEPMLASIGMPKGSPLRDKIDRVTQPLMEGRIFEKFVLEDIQQRRHARLSSPLAYMDEDLLLDPSFPFLGNLIGAFYILVAGLMVCIIQGVTEMIYFKFFLMDHIIRRDNERLANVVMVLPRHFAAHRARMERKITCHSGCDTPSHFRKSAMCDGERLHTVAQGSLGNAWCGLVTAPSCSHQ